MSWCSLGKDSTESLPSQGARIVSLSTLCRDGENNNLSWNCGEEGPTEDPRILRLRARQQRNLAAALLLSQGVPMVVMGDEYGHSKVIPMPFDCSVQAATLALCCGCAGDLYSNL